MLPKFAHDEPGATDEESQIPQLELIKSGDSKLTPRQRKGLAQQLAPILTHCNAKASRLEENPLQLQHTVNAPLIAISNLLINPGQKRFYLWYVILAYFPILSLCIGPVANMFSIIALIEHWRLDMLKGVDGERWTQETPDNWRVTVLNSCLLGVALIANIALFGNVSGSVHYTIAIWLLMICWTSAWAMILSALLITRTTFGDRYHPLEGFYMACCTCFFYFLNAVVLVVNYLGVLLRMYPPAFNLNTKQRTLMVFTILFCIWCIVGSLSMQHLIGKITHASLLYYCTVLYFTIGLGDIVAKSDLGRAVVLILLLVGTLLMALIVTNIRLVVMLTLGPTIFWHQVEKGRKRKVQKYKREGKTVDFDTSFEKMRHIQKRAKVRQLNFNLFVTVMVFCVFWLVGALVFYLVEDWRYFDGVYYCFLCLLTIGYGDFAPETAFGRVFFICWAILAVPMMTILLSNMGDKLYDWLGAFTTLFHWLLFWRSSDDTKPARAMFSLTSGAQKVNSINAELSRTAEPKDSKVNASNETLNAHDSAQLLNEKATENLGNDINKLGQFSTRNSQLDATPLATPQEHSLSSQVSRRTSGIENPQSDKPPFRKIDDWERLCKKLKTRIERQERLIANLDNYLLALHPIMRDVAEDLEKQYSLEQWKEIFKVISRDELRYLPPLKHEAESDEWYWLGEGLPLRIPLKEPNFMMMKLYGQIEEDVAVLLQRSMVESRKLKHFMDKITTWIDSSCNENERGPDGN